MLPFILNAFESFFKRHPALLYGFSILLGCTFALTLNYLLMIPTLLLLFSGRRAFFAYPLLIASFYFVNSQFIKPVIPLEGLTGKAHFEISSLASKSTHFGKHFVYKGIIKSFSPHSHVKNILVAISVPSKNGVSRPPADSAYLIEGNLKEVADNHYVFTPEKDNPWEAIESTFALSEIRYSCKKFLSQFIHKKIEDHDSATFLSGIATGEFDDRLMLFHFSRFGLQHIMAISGFHFAIISGILRAILQFLFSRKIATILLIAFLTSYFLFLGFAPSILRAWLMILIVLIGYLLQKSSLALNSLGIALMAVLLIDPLMVRHIGFQFSFVTTASILIFYSASDYALQKVFHKRPLSLAVEMNSMNQHGFLILTLLRQSTALCIAVNIAAIPLMLYHFEQFPYLSIIYNFFFPFMVSISMLLLILGFLIPVFPFIHDVNSAFTTFLLKFTHNMPQTVDYKLEFQGFAFEAVVIYFCLLFFTGVMMNYYFELKRDERLDFEYL